MKESLDYVKREFRKVLEVKFIAMISSLMLTPIMISHSSLRIVYPDNSMYDVFLAFIIYIGFFFIYQNNINASF